MLAGQAGRGEEGRRELRGGGRPRFRGAGALASEGSRAAAREWSLAMAAGWTVLSKPASSMVAPMMARVGVRTGGAGDDVDLRRADDEVERE